MKLLAGLLDLLFPPRRACPLCGAPGDQNSICAGCLDRLDGFRSEPVCYRCGRYFLPGAAACRPAGERDGTKDRTGDRAVFCRDCSRGEPSFSLARAVGPYEGDLKKAVQRLKFTGRRGLADHLADLMFQAALNNPYYIMTQVITAVPLSRERLRQRGFNQSDLLAAGLAERMRVPFLPLLRKIRETPPQTKLDRAGREENLRGAFEAGEGAAVRGKTILLVDDVITTGNTLNIVSRALVESGAATVICITAAAGRTYSIFQQRSL